MIRIGRTLLPEHILLNIGSKSREEAVRQLCEALRSDTRISDWQEFSAALRKREAAGAVPLKHGLTLPHVRTSVVTRILMAFGRLTDPLREEDGLLQFVVLVGIPRTMDAEYLRLVGTLMRVFRNEKLRQKLLEAKNPARILEIFEKGETEIDREE
jgi:mannitol/fructose-specific phosphotransferase system IIA component (Ntr-type)